MQMDEYEANEAMDKSHHKTTGWIGLGQMGGRMAAQLAKHH
eukprot:gene53291-16392_t